MLSLTIGSRFDVDVIESLLPTIQNINISFFGSPSSFQLDGGRIVSSDMGNFFQFIDQLRDLHIPFNICANTTLDSDQISISQKTWEILEYAYSSVNGVVVSRHWLAEKIRNRFPDYNMIFSSIGILSEKWDEYRLFSEYQTVVCPVIKTNDFKLLKNDENWKKLEIFLNNECIGFDDNCIKHYQFNSKVNARLIKNCGFICPNIKTGRKCSRNIQPTYYDITKYVDMGVTKFKVIERISLIQDYQRYITLLSQASS